MGFVVVMLFLVTGVLCGVILALIIHFVLSTRHRNRAVRHLFETSTGTAAGNLQQRDDQVGVANRQSSPMMVGHNHQDHLRRVQRIRVR